MILWHISDTHGFHKQLQVPEKVDIIIHSGDCSNQRNHVLNYSEVADFLDWYQTINCKHKIFCAGNHDGSIESGMFRRYDFEKRGITYLCNESVTIEGLNIWGSPMSPSFGDWSFMRKREKLYDLWQTIPEDTDILVTHTPPKGVLDLSEDREGKLEMCGCKALLKRVMVVKPKLHLFGHLHTGHELINTGIRRYNMFETIFSNASAVEDGKFDKGIVFNGNIIEI